jgi:hypothetical protein
VGRESATYTDMRNASIHTTDEAVCEVGASRKNPGQFPRVQARLGRGHSPVDSPIYETPRLSGRRDRTDRFHGLAHGLTEVIHLRSRS